MPNSWGIAEPWKYRVGGKPGYELRLNATQDVEPDGVYIEGRELPLEQQEAMLRELRSTMMRLSAPATVIAMALSYGSKLSNDDFAKVTRRFSEEMLGFARKLAEICP